MNGERYSIGDIVIERHTFDGTITVDLYDTDKVLRDEIGPLYIPEGCKLTLALDKPECEHKKLIYCEYGYCPDCKRCFD